MSLLHLLHIKSDVKYIYESNTLRQGLEKMRCHGYTAIPVISEEGDYVGTVSEGDFLWHILRNEKGSIKDQEQYFVNDIIRKDFMPAVNITATTQELFDRATRQNFVPVVDDRNKFIGIITRRDIIKYCFEKMDMVHKQ